MNRTDDLHATLRTLDPADRHVDPASPRARADLQAILASDPTAPSCLLPSGAPTTTGRSRGRTATTRRVVLATGTAAAATAAMVVLPPLTGSDEAFATWTATPAGLSELEQAQAADDCRAAQELGPGVPADLVDDLAGAAPVIAERRGAWTTVLLAGADGFTAMCIADDSTRPFATGSIGLVARVVPEPHEVVVTEVGVGTTDAGDMTLVAGAAGADITGVVHRSRVHGDVAATVNGGYFALWFPGDELSTPVDDVAVVDEVELEITYEDGTTATRRLSF